MSNLQKYNAVVAEMPEVVQTSPAVQAMQGLCEDVDTLVLRKDDEYGRVDALSAGVGTLITTVRDATSRIATLEDSTSRINIGEYVKEADLVDIREDIMRIDAEYNGHIEAVLKDAEAFNRRLLAHTTRISELGEGIRETNSTVSKNDNRLDKLSVNFKTLHDDLHGAQVTISNLWRTVDDLRAEKDREDQKLKRTKLARAKLAKDLFDRFSFFGLGVVGTWLVCAVAYTWK